MAKGRGHEAFRAFLDSLEAERARLEQEEGTARQRVQNLRGKLKALEKQIEDTRAWFDRYLSRPADEQQTSAIEAMAAEQPGLALPGLPMRGGRPVRWALMQRVCDNIPGLRVSVKAVAAKLVEEFPGQVDANPSLVSRDMARKPEIWERVPGERGTYLCKWKSSPNGNGVAESVGEGAV